MRLKELKIHEYKNLKDLTVTFDEDNYIDILVGKNGSGKSNFFEALIVILGRLITVGDTFLEEIAYKINFTSCDNNIQFEDNLEHDDSNLSEIDFDNENFIEFSNLIDNVIVYYSGHNDSIEKIINAFDNAYGDTIKKQKLQPARSIIGINQAYKQLLLALILLQDSNNSSKKHVMSKLGINIIGDEIKINFKPPNYAGRNAKQYEKGYSLDVDFWKVNKEHKAFLNRIELLSKTNRLNNKIIRDTGYIDYNTGYIFYCGIEDFKNEFSDYDIYGLFVEFDRLMNLGMLGEISIQVQLENGFDANVATFSDGQFQSVYIYALTEIFKGKNCVTLLDEPDSFLHPEWQAQFLKQIFDIGEDSLKNNHIIMTSHSAATISQSENKNLGMFVFDDGQVKVEKHSIGEIIRSLSSGIMSYSEVESLISITKALKSTSRAILFVEGITDVLILEKAYEVLFPNVKDIEIVAAFDAKSVRRILSEKHISENCPDKFFFGLFDFDTAWGEYNGLKSTKNEEFGNCVTGLYKKVLDTKCYCMMLPIPDGHALKSQVVKKDGSHWKMHSNFTIEHYFYNKVDEKFFKKDETNPSEHIIFCSDRQKHEFAKNIVAALPDNAFEDLRPIFENIYNIMQQENKTGTNHA